LSRRLGVSILTVLLLAGLPAAAMAQEGSEGSVDSAPIWGTAVKNHAYDVAAYGDGFVLVGGADRKPRARIWLSEDGVDWPSVQGGKAFDGVALRRVATFDGGIVALGSQGRKLVGFHSPDGVSWKKRTIDRAPKGMELFPQAMTDGPAGLVAVAGMYGQDFAGQRFYGSQDGRTWAEIDPPSDTAPGMFNTLVSTDDEYFAVARPMFASEGDFLWRSADAVTWEPFEGPPDGNLHDLAIGPDGTFVAIGDLTQSFTPAIWRAEELGSWERVYDAPSSKETEERLDLVAVGGPGFIAGGSTSGCPEQSNRYCPTAAILASSDGREWQAWGIDEGVPGPLHDSSPRAVAANGDTTAMIAWHDDRRPEEVWTFPPGQ
jgi:hypothetical protein